MSDLKRLRITEKGFLSYTGPIGVYMFENGLSVEGMPRNERDRIATTMSFVEVDDDDSEGAPAGVAQRLVSDSKNRAALVMPLKRQTDQDKEAEQIEQTLNIGAKDVQIYSADELDAIIEDKGIAGLRTIAVKWNRKHRAIPVLRQMILDAQAEWVEKRDDQAKRRAELLGDSAPVTDTSVADTPDDAQSAPADADSTSAAADVSGAAKTETAAPDAAPDATAPDTADTDWHTDEQDGIKQAAQSGDMSAALTEATKSESK